MDFNEIMSCYGYSTDSAAALNSGSIRVGNGTSDVGAVNVTANPNSYRVEAGSDTPHQYLSFMDVVSGDMTEAIPLHQRTVPKIVGGKVAIAIDETEAIPFQCHSTNNW